MAQVFHPLANYLARTTIFGAVFIALGALATIYAFSTSDYATQAHVVRAQPVEFSHQHHVGGLGIDCRYCHSTVDKQAFAGLPATEVCMSCHSQIWSDSPKLAKVRESFKTGKPLEWTRVTDVPDYVHFDHSIHVTKGIGCTECHGRVDRMPMMAREHSLQMKWCLDCHWTPEDHVRPRSDVFKMQLASPTEEESKELVEKYRLKAPTHCSACHY
ncbi:MAG TPA: cytochrome c3 family protein [Caulifigura sp.]|nr:cytochrome c3 family protein [Caulifigura sp.]